MENSQIKAVLFDLDGTLLPMDQDEFVKAYFGGIAKKLAPYGYEPNKLIKSIWAGTAAMVKNDGTKTNETAFWDAFAGIYGEQVRLDEPYFDAFYREDFDKIQSSCGYTPKALKTVEWIKKTGLRMALATNPIFPAIATKKRIRWAGLDENAFEWITTYENSKFCKPNLNYYMEILNELHILPSECIMVGNDVGEDMVAEKLGMKVFLLTDCLINKQNTDISVYPHGTFEDLTDYIQQFVQIQ